jgi:hypothetical protein
MLSVKVKFLRDADRLCVKRGLVVVPASTSGHDAGFGVPGACEVVFHAVSKEDAESVRPSLEAVQPKEIIEHRER